MQITGRQEEAEHREELMDEWRALGRVIDRFMFVISLIAIVFLCAWMAISGTLAPTPGTHDDEQQATSDDHH